MYLSKNHGGTAWDIGSWIEEELGVDPKHFSLWARGECDKEWTHNGCMTDEMIPEHVAYATYDENAENHRNAPDGYRTYEYCKIAVDPKFWTEYEIDYTRDEWINRRTPEEERDMAAVTFDGFCQAIYNLTRKYDTGRIVTFNEEE